MQLNLLTQNLIMTPSKCLTTSAFITGSRLTLNLFRRFSSRSPYFRIIADREKDELATKNGFDLAEFPPEKIRNFSIIAHIDHGKSTLADRLLELTGTIKPGLNQPQYLDKLQTEGNNGVKAQTTSMLYNYTPSDQHRPSTSFLLNLIDTPGHVDFSYEVSRSLAACQGVLLVVDAAQGIQAQTVANFYLASECNLAVIPVINKIDLPVADPEKVKNQLRSTLDIDPDEALLASAKTGEGLEKVLEAIVERIPPPGGRIDASLRMLLFDSFFHDYKKVVCYVAIVDGVLRKGDRIVSAGTGRGYKVSEVGIMHPEFKPTACLATGQVGYLVCGMHSTQEARVGDTLYKRHMSIEPLPGFQPAKHMVFSGLYPADGTGMSELEHAIEKLTWCSSWSGFQVWFSRPTSYGCVSSAPSTVSNIIGLIDKMMQEYGVHVHNTVPTVPYIFEFKDGSKVEMHMCTDLYKDKKLKAIWEPMVVAKIILPSEYLGSVITLCVDREGEQLQFSYISCKQALLKYRLPLREIAVDFYDVLKTITSGYAIFMYEEAEHRLSELVKLDAFLNNKKVDVLATIVHKSRTVSVGNSLLEMLKKYIDRSQVNSIMITEAISGVPVSVQRIPAAPLERKGAKPKNKLKPQQTVSIPREAFLERMKLS